MSLFVFCIVLCAALLHATWNALVKGGLGQHNDKHLNIAAIMVGHCPLAFIAVIFLPFPHMDSLPYMMLGVLLHLGYNFFLAYSYSIGDLTQVYPLARGVAPLIVTFISVTFLGVILLPLQFLAIGLIAVGILSLCFVRRSVHDLHLKTVFAALITGCFIAGYSLVDGLGARVSGSAVSFFAWQAIITAFIMLLYMLAFNRQRLQRLFTPETRPLLLGGGSTSFCAYALVVWAFTQAPIPLVTALRETSIIFALLIGVFILKERLNLLKVLSTCTTLAGLFVLRLIR